MRSTVLGVGSCFTLKLHLQIAGHSGLVPISGIWPLSNYVLDLGYGLSVPWTYVVRAGKHHVDGLPRIPCSLAFSPALSYSWRRMLNLSASAAPLPSLERRGCWEMTSGGVQSEKRAEGVQRDCVSCECWGRDFLNKTYHLSFSSGAKRVAHRGPSFDPLCLLDVLKFHY